VVPDVMVDEEVTRMVDSFERASGRRGIEPEQYYQLAGARTSQAAGQQGRGLPSEGSCWMRSRRPRGIGADERSVAPDRAHRRTPGANRRISRLDAAQRYVPASRRDRPFHALDFMSRTRSPSVPEEKEGLRRTSPIPIRAGKVPVPRETEPRAGRSQGPRPWSGASEGECFQDRQRKGIAA